ncbi:MAG: DEAD/DEAH box helicase [Clostridia bacterium]|nr:DEAD/DEAH box helicase [Clostridia bacterium]
MINSDYQAKYIVHELERVYANDDVAKLSGLMFDAQITPTPHQIDASLFALNTPNTKGVLLADEVGLGKTIEAGIVIMQYWAERKRKILIVAPSSLRQQWLQELQEKFNLPSRIIDSKNTTNKLILKDGIYICSYEFANRNIDKLSTGWNLLVLDEAHKLRNFYSNKHGIAGSISSIAKGAEKALLLTATPLQNRLEELYGLVSAIDPGYFHSLDVFKQRYIKSESPFALNDLRSRIGKIAKRTLREDAKKYIKYTNRIAKTITFEPSGEEKRLYELVDDYLHREKLYAFASSQRHLSALILRKRLGSSTFAVASTLRRIIARMEEEYNSGQLRNNRGGFIEFDDLQIEEIEAFESSGEIDSAQTDTLKERAEFKAEIEELKSYAELAESIKSNVKAENLVNAVNIGFSSLESKAAKKAIIFTESTITQSYIGRVLDREGFAGKYIKFNGQNKSPETNKIYQEWLEKNKDSDLVTGTESADRRKALIDSFRDNDIQIMIATEAASEGINLQFCSMLINYDLPWNPQRVEQRIGRIHRMGQQFDVVVVNFSNQGNTAEARILDLLANKFNLFKSTFGASNEVLGAIEDGFDFEQQISKILNTCRTDAEINKGFQDLQNKYKNEIESEHDSYRAKIFDSLDPHVQDRFKKYSKQSNEAFNSFERLFSELTNYELRDFANFEADGHVFDLHSQPIPEAQTGIYFYKTDRVPHAKQYKYADTIGEYVRHTAKSTATPAAHLTFSIAKSERASSLAKKLAGKTGTLTVKNVTFPMKSGSTDMSESYIISAGETLDGELIDSETCRDIFDLKLVSENPSNVQISDNIQNLINSQITKRQAEVKDRNTEVYLDKKDILERQYKDKIVELEIKIDKLKRNVSEKERQERQAPNAEERLKVAAEKQTLRKKIRSLNQQMFDLEDKMDDEISEKITLAQQASVNSVKIEPLFEIDFSII